MADLVWFKGHQFFDDSGNPLNAGTINTYDATTLSARTVYQDDGAATPWSQPITLNSAGRLTASVYVPTGDWKFILKNAAGTAITTEDNIPGALAATSTDFANPERPIVTKAANYTITVADIGSLFVVDSTGGTVTLTLPAAGLVATGRGIAVLHNGTANSVVLDGNGAETINGAATLTLPSKPGYVEITSDGSALWYASFPVPTAGGQLTGALDWKTVVSVASAATVDLGAQTSNLVEITGATGPLTSLGTAVSGKFRWVKFASNPTITHNATSLILPGAANIIAAAGDTALFVSEGSGNWRCYTYRAAIAAPGIPIGAILPYGGTAAPGGYVLAFGQAISRTTYAALFGVFSTTYGVGDGTTTFNVPDLRGRVIAGQDDMGGTSADRLTGLSGGVDGDVLGGTGGEEAHTTTTVESAAHTHFIAAVGSGADSTPDLSASSQMITLNDSGGSTSYDLDGVATAATIGLTSSTGGGGAHNNVQPVIILNYIVYAGA